MRPEHDRSEHAAHGTDGRAAVNRSRPGFRPFRPAARFRYNRGVAFANGVGMHVVITGRHLEVTEAMRQHAEQKAGKLTHYYDRIQEIEVIFDGGKQAVACEVIVNAEDKRMFVANHDEGDAYSCINACVDKLERQLSEHKKKVRNRKHPG
jgi:putative sigma-54 modulation protein